VMNMAHWAQSIRAGTFSQYDYGLIGNLQHYGSISPPAYNLNGISTPIAIFSGGQDSLADPDDVGILLEQLPPGVIRYVNNQPDYEHLDFTWGLDLHTRIYPNVTSLLSQFAPQSSKPQPPSKPSTQPLILTP